MTSRPGTLVCNGKRPRVTNRQGNKTKLKIIEEAEDENGKKGVNTEE
jgi:hypothetical protein